MNKIDIPQERNSTLDGQQKVMYAPNDNGEFKKFNYSSNVEEYATKLAVQEYNELVNQSLKNIENGKSSPIEYFMYKNRMDIPTLASIMGIFSFRIKRHLKAKIFIKLNNKLLEKYANIFQITVDELKGFKNDKRV